MNPAEIPQTSNTEAIPTWRDLTRLGREDLRNASGSERIAAAGTLGLMWYELGPGGNETLTALIFGQVTENTTSILPGSLAAGAATAGFIAIEQYLGGKLTIKSLDAFPRTAEASFSLLNKKSAGNEPTFRSFSELPFSKRLAYAIAGGTYFTVNREHFAVGETDRKKLNATNISSLLTTSIAVGTTVGTIDAAKKAVHNDTVDRVTETVLHPLVITGLVTAAVIAGIAKNRRQHRRSVSS